MRVPNLMMVRFDKHPVMPFDTLAASLSDLEQVVWSVVGAGGRTSPMEREHVLDVARRFPNVTGLVADDFWENGKAEHGFALSLAELTEVKRRARLQHLDLWSVLYVGEMFRKEGVIRPYLDLFDRHTLWVWDPRHLKTVGEKLDMFRDFVGGKKYMGVYMWDFERSQPMPLEYLESQCEAAWGRVLAGELAGMVFLATTLCDRGIGAVEWVRDWVEKL